VASDIQSRSDSVVQVDNKSEPVSTVGAPNKNYQSYQNRQPIDRKWNGNQRKQYTGCYLCGSKNHKKLECNATEAEIANYAAQKSPSGTESDKPAIASRGSKNLTRNSAVYLRIQIKGKSYLALIDSGCEMSLCPARLIHSTAIKPSNQQVFAANGTPIEIVGQAQLVFSFGSYTTSACVLVSSDVEELMLGIDFLESHDCVWDFSRKILRIDGYSVALMSQKSPVLCRRVFVARDVWLPPKAQSAVKARSTVTSLRSEGGASMVEAGQIADGVHSARVLLPDRQHDIAVQLINTSDEVQLVKQGTCIGVLKPVTVCSAALFEGKEGRDVDELTLPPDPDQTLLKTVDDVETKFSSKQICSQQNADNESLSETDDMFPGDWTQDEKSEDYMTSLLQSLPAELSEEERQQAEKLLKDYADVFSKGEYDIGLTDMAELRIDTGTHRPIRQPLRRHPVAQLDIIDQQVEDMLAHDLIEPSVGPWASNVILVRRKDGLYRFCVDLRAVNSCTYKDAYPLPNIGICLDSLNGASWFATLDLRAGYHNVPIALEDRDKTAFITRRGIWRYKRMPFGVTNGPAVMQRLVDLVLTGLTLETCLVYLDDCLVFGRSFSELHERLGQVLQRFRESKLKLKGSKCLFYRRIVSFLGHRVSEQGLSPLTDKVAAVRDWPVPQCISDVRSFVSLCSYYRRMIGNFATIAAPLHALTKKNSVFKWGSEENRSFETLKEKLISEPIVALPRSEGKFVLDTDASAVGLGAVLSQEQDSCLKVIDYASRL